ncbi:hypothetical protein [Paenibacillus sp. N3.4]|uniref:hypothetical protein n=1 Tax=Paenibacillus sp. N3.4 TaxID=2603222 RepID=UPI0011CA1C97|nr:hypothetical protein [Paenibacillus sp. N3.4]TXK85558.1 hypothetical protein FU659_03115 [Paenibacillus sp. N3.4]
MTKAEPGSIQAIIPDTKNNKLILSVEDMSSVKTSKFNSLFGTEKDFLAFIPKISTKLEADTTNYGDPFPSGSLIQSNTHGCTAGYFGDNQANQVVLVTAGHCANVGSTEAWYQPWTEDPKIGNWTFRTTSSNSDGSDAVGDAGYITLTSRGGNPRVPYPNSSTLIPYTGVYTSDMVGDTVYLRGAFTGALSAGVITHSNVLIWWGNSGYGYENNLVFVQSYASIGGDSGGPILTDYAWDNSKGSYTFDLAGTHVGVATFKDNQYIPDGAYKVYNPIWRSYTDLNLDSIYVVH